MHTNFFFTNLKVWPYISYVVYTEHVYDVLTLVSVVVGFVGGGGGCVVQ